MNQFVYLNSVFALVYRYLSDLAVFMLPRIVLWYQCQSCSAFVRRPKPVHIGYEKVNTLVLVEFPVPCSGVARLVQQFYDPVERLVVIVLVRFPGFSEDDFYYDGSFAHIVTTLYLAQCSGFSALVNLVIKGNVTEFQQFVVLSQHSLGYVGWRLQGYTGNGAYTAEVFND